MSAFGPIISVCPFLSGSTLSSFFSMTIPSLAKFNAVAFDSALSFSIDLSSSGLSNRPNVIKVCSICCTFSSMVFSFTIPFSITGISFSFIINLPIGISKSSPPLAAPTVEYTEVQSDIRIPLNPHCFLSISIFIHAFSVACTPLTGL